MAYKRILVAVDGSDISRQALQEAIMLAKEFSSVIHIITVADEYVGYAEGISINFDAYAAAVREYGDKTLKEMEALVKKSGIEYEIKLIEVNKQPDLIPEKIIEEAGNWKADLIVIGTHGRRGFSRLLLGSVAESVVRLANGPVLLVKGQHSNK